MTTKTEKMLELERQRGEPMEKFLPELLDALGSIEAAAAELQVSENTVKAWLMRLGLRRRYTWVKETDLPKEARH